MQDDYLFAILYLFAGIYFLGRLWTSRSLKAVELERMFVPRAFMGEEIHVELKAKNSGYLPLIWMKIHESVPIELASISKPQQVISLKPKGNYSIHYYLHARKRGYYPIGPLSASSGDLFGLSTVQRKVFNPDYLTIFPKVVYLKNIPLPTFSPMGTLPQRKPIFEDPTRIYRKRGYISGDSLRNIDWKATAVTRKLQVKMFEPSVTLDTMIFLNLNKETYKPKRRSDFIELSIVVAASIAYWSITHKHSLGLCTNGIDPLNNNEPFQSLISRKGRGHLLHILELLARVAPTSRESMIQLLQRERSRLSWGTTMIIITGELEEHLFDELYKSKRAGMNIALIIIGDVSDWIEINAKAEYYKFPITHLRNEFDLDIWRR